MSLDYRPQTTTAEQYAEIFEKERQQEYPAVDAFEQRMGYAIDRTRLEAAARVLSCPFKAAAPNWQHGRVIYAAVRRYLAGLGPDPDFVNALDVGTAKGFSALCARWALNDSGVDGGDGRVISVDVMDPHGRVRRNTPAECDGLKTLAEIMSPWDEASDIGMCFLKSTGVEFLQSRPLHERFNVAFIDGKHSTDAVSQEWRLLSKLQQPGDVAIFDDVQMEPVSRGLKGADAAYTFERLSLGHVNRTYAIGVRK